MYRWEVIVPLLLSIFLFSFFPGKYQEDCRRFHAGKFIYEKYVPDYAIIINRNDSIQTESDSKKSFLLRERIDWTSSCEYVLIFLSREPNYPSWITEERKASYDRTRRIPLRTRILEVGKDYCVFESNKEGIEHIYRDTLWVFK
jgi:hypothetical protein